MNTNEIKIVSAPVQAAYLTKVRLYKAEKPYTYEWVIPQKNAEEPAETKQVLRAEVK